MTQLALLPDTRPPATRVRRTRDLLAFDAESAAKAFLERHGDLWSTTLNGKVTMRVKPREVAGEWLLCSWWSGYPWCLNQRRVLKRMRAEDVK